MSVTHVDSFYVDAAGVDDDADRDGLSNHTWADLRDGAGTGVNADGSALTTQVFLLAAASPADQWRQLSRAFFLFSTTIPSDAVIVSARLRLVVSAVTNNFADSLVVVAATPASNTAIVAADYQQVGAVALSDTVAVASLVADDATYNALPLNTAGLAAINRDGLTKLAVRSLADFNNAPPTWGANSRTQVQFRTTEAADALQPILEVTYTMSMYSDIITAVKARLDTVTNIGLTHGYNRYNADWSTYLAHFRSTIGGVAQVRGWIVTMEDNNPIVGHMEDARYGAIGRTYNVLIFGFLGLDDSANTEQTFLNLVEAVMDAVDGRTDLGLAGVTDYGVGPASLRTYQIRQLGSVLCHYCEIALSIETVLAQTYA